MLLGSRHQGMPSARLDSRHKPKRMVTDPSCLVLTTDGGSPQRSHNVQVVVVVAGEVTMERVFGPLHTGPAKHLLLRGWRQGIRGGIDSQAA